MLKNYIIITVFAFVVIFFTQNAYADDCWNEMTPAEWNCGNWRDTTDTFIIDYYNCEVTFYYQIRECTYSNPECPFIPIKRVFQMKPVFFDWNYEDCASFTSYLIPGWPNDFSNTQPARMVEILKELQNKASERSYEYFYDNVDPSEKVNFQCTGSYPNCDAPNICAPSEYFWTASKCMAFCLVELINEDTEYRAYPTPCSFNEAVCCTYKTTFCICENPNPPYDRIFNKTVEIIQPNADCTTIDPDNGCEWLMSPTIQVKTQTPCVDYCGEE